MRQAVIGWAVLGLLASACASTAVEQAPPAEPDVVIVEEPVVTVRPDSRARERFRAALELLETGATGRARVELIAYLQEQPRSGVASDLLRQIEADALEYYPPEHRDITLASGESLSSLAQRYLGGMYQFHALAKYNGITEPRRLQAGQTLRIPLTETAIAAFAVDDEAEAPVDDVAASAGTAPALGQAASEDIAAAPSVGAVEADAEAEAEEAPAEVRPLPALAQTSAGNPAHLHREALNALRAHNLEKAIGLWDQALALDPEHESATLYRAQALDLQDRLRQLN